jgi:hypothetical protein
VRRTSQRMVYRESLYLNFFCFFSANHFSSPFDQVNVQCFLPRVCVLLAIYQACTHSDFEGQYTNAINVINGDSKNISTIYIYDTTAKSWSAQTTTTKGVSGGGLQFDPTNVAAILDHDPNVFCKNKSTFFLPNSRRISSLDAHSNFKELFRFNITLLKSTSLELFLGSMFKHPTLHPGNLRTHTSLFLAGLMGFET